MRRGGWWLLGVVAVVAVACGGGGADDLTDDTVPRIVDSTVPGEPGAESAELTPQEEIISAFADLGTGRAFRTTAAMAQTNRIPALGVDAVSKIDPDRPMLRMEVAANGDVHQYLDMGPSLSTMAGGDPELSALLDPVHAEIWLVGDRLIIDATGYQPVADLAPNHPLGPFSPGVGEVDLAALGEMSVDDVLAVIVGNVVNPITLAATLPASLADIERDPNTPGRFTALVPYDELLAAQGADPALVVRTMAASIAPLMGVEIDDYADFLSSYFETLYVDVEIQVDDGLLESIRIDADMSGIYDAMFADPSLLAGTPEQRDEAAAIVDGAEQRIESLTTFELDDTIVVTPPTGEFEDRTKSVLDFMAQIVAG